MKRIISSLVLITLIISASSTFAQTPKYGHLNVNELISLMPEKGTAEASLQSFAKDLEGQLASMQTELETKYTEYMQTESTLNDLLKATKQEELQNLNSRIQDFQQRAEQSYAKKEAELLQPILDKANQALQDVGKEHGYTYIFDTSTGVLVYIAEGSDDVLPLVKAKLGIAEEAKTE